MIDLEKASAKVRKCLTTSGGGAKAEAEYALAYQQEVAAGKRRQLKGKYRMPR